MIMLRALENIHCPYLFFVIINRGYYMAARGYQISVRMLKKSFTSERSERVKYFFKTRKEISYLRAAM